jgi:hypothetical protein
MCRVQLYRILRSRWKVLLSCPRHTLNQTQLWFTLRRTKIRRTFTQQEHL